MRQLIKVLIVAVVLAGGTGNVANAQCKGFAKSLCKKELGAYLHDGNYHAAVLVEGEEAELYKTFYSDMEYRVAICGADGLPPIEFTIFDSTGKILYNNKGDGYKKFWDFKLEASQQLKIVVKVTTFPGTNEIPA
ncbi:MAG TPA: hypothetical protein PLP69_09335, partial [Bacteroidales bacterium]|nr:hypothetical protein [Bacteroidales bacterium]